MQNNTLRKIMQLLDNVVLVSTIQDSESSIHMHISPVSWISFPLSSPQSAEESSLCRTGGSHHECECVSCSVLSGSLRPCGLQPARLLCPWDSSGKNTRVGCHSLLQEIFPTQGSKLGLLHCRQILSEPPNSHQLSTIYIESIVYMLLLLLNRFSRVRLCVTPQTAAHQAPLSLGFSRQEHWSGLPVPSPMNESEIESEATVLSDSLRPYGLRPTRLLRPWDCPGKSSGVGCHCLLQQCIYVNPKKDVVYIQ